MLRVLPIAILLGTVALASGCSKGPDYEVILDAKGTGSATEVSYLTPGSAVPTVEKNVKLPWHAGSVPDKPGRIVLEVTAGKGSRATCRIEVEHVEVAKKVGADGEKVTCEKVLKELPENR